MKNIEALRIFEQTHAYKIEKLFWIACSLDSDELRDLFEDDIDEDVMRELFPEIAKSKHFKYFMRDVLQGLVDWKKFGLIAEVHIPEASKIFYEGERPSSWQTNTGICRIEYVYAETLDELINQIKKVSEKVFQEYIEKDKKKKQAQSA